MGNDVERRKWTKNPIDVEVMCLRACVYAFFVCVATEHVFAITRVRIPLQLLQWEVLKIFQYQRPVVNIILFLVGL